MKALRLLLFAILLPLGAIVSRAAGPRHYILTEPTVIADSTAIFAISTARPLIAVEARVAIADSPRLRSGFSHSSFSLSLGDASLAIRRHSAYADNIDEGRKLVLTLAIAGGETTTIDNRELSADGGVNSILLEWTAPDSLTLFAGRRTLDPVITVAAPAPTEGAELSVKAEGETVVHSLVVEESEPSRDERLEGLSIEEVDSILSLDSGYGTPAGRYRYLDRILNPSTVRLGGRYRLAVIPSPDNHNEFLIIYLDGAEVEPTLWKPGMIKGRLRRTSYQGQYDLEWYDSHGEPIPVAADSYAVYDRSTSTLTLTFPALDASIRLAGE